MKPVTVFHLLTNARNQKVFDDIKIASIRTLNISSTAAQVTVGILQSSPYHTRATEDIDGQGATALQKN